MNNDYNQNNGNQADPTLNEFKFNNQPNNVNNTMNQGFNNQPMNNTMNQGFNNQQNMNNGMNQGYNGQNDYYGNNVNQPNYGSSYGESKKDNKKLFIIIGAIVGVIVIGVILFLVLGKGGGSMSLSGHKNTTGSKEYTASEVDYNCHIKNDEGEEFIDILFDVTDDKGNSLQMASFNKIIKTDTSDKKWHEIVDKLSASYCFNTFGKMNCDNETYPNHFDFGITSFGWSTVADKTSSEIIVTFNNQIGLNGPKTTAEEKKAIIDGLEAQGYTCK